MDQYKYMNTCHQFYDNALLFVILFLYHLFYKPSFLLSQKEKSLHYFWSAISFSNTAIFNYLRHSHVMIFGVFKQQFMCSSPFSLIIILLSAGFSAFGRPIFANISYPSEHSILYVRHKVKYINAKLFHILLIYL